MSIVTYNPFHRDLRTKLNEEIAKRTEQLVRGGATRSVDDAATVAEKYAAAVAYIEALRQVLAYCHSMDAERFHPTKEG